MTTAEAGAPLVPSDAFPAVSHHTTLPGVKRKEKDVSFFKEMKIGKKLYLVFSIIIVLVATLVAVAYLNLASLGKANKMNLLLSRTCRKITL